MKRIGIDVGGTFTDVLVVDEETGQVSWHKVSTTGAEPSVGVLKALQVTGLPSQEIGEIKHGTTIGVNALLTRTGSRTGLITTRGFRDVLQIRRTHRNRLFDLAETVPDPLVPRYLRMEVLERIGADGQVVVDLDMSSLRDSWQALRAEGIEALAIVFLFSFENPKHELAARDAILAEIGDVDIDISLSSEVLPTYREYERTSTTVTNAYIARPMRDYIGRLTEGLARVGSVPERLLTMTNSGGVMTPEAVIARPVSALMSGPAGGVIGGLWLAQAIGWRNVITMDMGGTSCDVSGIADAIPDERLDMDIGGLTISTPALDVQTIGAGGGSIAWIDPGGALRVGPASAGANPGPACYGRGGAEPTVTDANLILGYYDPEILLGGSIGVDKNLARDAIRNRIADPLGLTIEEAAAGIIRIVNAHMLNAVHYISVERGRDPRDFALIGFGGAGPAHAADIARELGMSRVLIPPFPGCTSAFGAAISSSRYDFVQSVLQMADVVDAEVLNSKFLDLIGGARAALRREGISSSREKFEVWLELRYQGQAHNLSVELRLGRQYEAIGRADLDTAIGDFHKMHSTLYGHSFQDVPVELVNLHVRGIGTMEELPLHWEWQRSRPQASATRTARSSRPVYFLESGTFLDTPIFFREELDPTRQLSGPCIIHQTDATIVVPPHFHVVPHETGSLILQLDSKAGGTSSADDLAVT